MQPLSMFETILSEFARAVMAAHRYESLKYGRASHGHVAPADIPKQIFDEFYACEGDADASTTSAEWMQSAHQVPIR